MRLELVQPRLVVAAPRLREIVEGHRIEIVVGERDEAEPEAAELDDLADDAVDPALARLLAVGPPDRAERTVLRTAAHGLHRRPHVAVLGQQIPPRRHELVAARPVRRRRSAAASRRSNRATTFFQTRSPSPLTTACARHGRALPRGRASRGCRRRRPRRRARAPAGRFRSRAARCPLDADADDVARLDAFRSMVRAFRRR